MIIEILVLILKECVKFRSEVMTVRDPINISWKGVEDLFETESTYMHKYGIKFDQKRMPIFCPNHGKENEGVVGPYQRCSQQFLSLIV